MGTKISHSGIIESIDDGCIHVRIVQTSACAACKVAGYCHAAESKEKIVDVYKPAGNLKVDDAVTVTASAQIATQALLFGFAYPFVLLVVVLVAGLVRWSLFYPTMVCSICFVKDIASNLPSTLNKKQYNKTNK